MEIKVAGYNIDNEIIDSFKEFAGKLKLFRELKDDEMNHEILNEIVKSVSKLPNKDEITPETISAAYARISRDSRPVYELRRESRKEVERSRKSSRSIIFNMGHSSVAEHAVFNFDIINISRLAAEFLQRHRLCSFTEKSQRYIKFDDDFIVPEEIKGTKAETIFLKAIKKQNDCYHELFDGLMRYYKGSRKDLASESKGLSVLEGMAKEDARYVTSLAVSTQMGATMNARNLENIISRSAGNKLNEIRLMGKLLYEKIKGIAPSLIKYTESTKYGSRTNKNIIENALPAYNIEGYGSVASKPDEDVRLVKYDADSDIKIAASLLFAGSACDYMTCENKARDLSDKEKKDLFQESLRHIQQYDHVLRAYENSEFLYEMIVSASCFAQLKRHRMATILVQDYDPSLNYTMPPAIFKAKLEKPFREVMAATSRACYNIKNYCPEACLYVLANANRRRVLLKVNARESYHISRLREDEHAQWDIRDKAGKMMHLASAVAPLTFMLSGGKNVFSEKHVRLYGNETRTV
ncbi:MAG: FAD-dependent thymidylate synthase [Candidatus Theseobacter exili]|nr:FAD-dependent thymidylate synthase [Candidatus Theseobacter exili]